MNTGSNTRVEKQWNMFAMNGTSIPRRLVDKEVDKPLISPKSFHIRATSHIDIKKILIRLKPQFCLRDIVSLRGLYRDNGHRLRNFIVPLATDISSEIGTTFVDFQENNVTRDICSETLIVIIA